MSFGDVLRCYHCLESPGQLGSVAMDQPTGNFPERLALLFPAGPYLDLKSPQSATKLARQFRELPGHIASDPLQRLVPTAFQPSDEPPHTL